jgi:hypothetical protein
MPMDDTEKKLLCMLNAPYPGERANAAEALNAHQQQIGHLCRDIVYEFENSVPLQQYTDEVNEHYKTKVSLQQYMTANAKWAQQYARYNTTVYFMEKIFPHIVAVGIVLAPICLALWMVFNFLSWITGESKAVRLAADQGFMSMLEGSRFAVGESGPEEFDVAGKPYWVIVRGSLVSDTNTDRKGRGLILQCLHLYATPAVVKWQSLEKPDPYSWLGSLRWPERATYCKPAGYADAVQKVENEQSPSQNDYGFSPPPLDAAGQNNAAPDRAGRARKRANRSR